MSIIPDDIKSKLLPYQKDHVENLVYSLKTYNRALDASDTGTGKTYTAIAACLTLNLKPLIICPKSVLTNWTNVLNSFNATYYGLANYETIQNCKFFTGKSKKVKVKCPYIRRIEETKESESEYKVKLAKKLETKKAVASEIGYTYVWENLPNDIIFIFDETHRCKNPRTVNSVLLYTLSKTNSKILMLSATVSDKPENFALAGFVLGLYKNIRNANNWIQNAGKEYENPMSGVHDNIFPEYASRMRIRDLGKIFPDNQVLAECYDTDNAEEIQKQYKIIEEEVERLKNKEDNSGCALSRILYCRMKIEMLKVPTFIELAKKY